MKLVRIMTHSCGRCSIVAFRLTVGLREIRGRVEQLRTQERAEASKELPRKMWSPVEEEIHWYAVRNYHIVKESQCPLWCRLLF